MEYINQLTQVPCQVIRQPVERFIRKKSNVCFDLIFADPPYHLQLGPSLLKQFHTSLFHDHTLVVIEHDKRDCFDTPHGWDQVFTRKYGDTLISIYQKLTVDPL